jgi:hypothetical protein
MTESEPSEPEPGARPGGDTLAARLLVAQRLLCSLEMEGDVRLRLQLRYAAICTSLKLPTVDRDRLTRRLDRLIADIERERGHDSAAGARAADNTEPGSAS